MTVLGGHVLWRLAKVWYRGKMNRSAPCMIMRHSDKGSWCVTSTWQKKPFFGRENGCICKLLDYMHLWSTISPVSVLVVWLPFICYYCRGHSEKQIISEHTNTWPHIFIIAIYFFNKP